MDWYRFQLEIIRNQGHRRPELSFGEGWEQCDLDAFKSFDPLYIHLCESSVADYVRYAYDHSFYEGWCESWPFPLGADAWQDYEQQYSSSATGYPKAAATIYGRPPLLKVGCLENAWLAFAVCTSTSCGPVWLIALARHCSHRWRWGYIDGCRLLAPPTPSLDELAEVNAVGTQLLEWFADFDGKAILGGSFPLLRTRQGRPRMDKQHWKYLQSDVDQKLKKVRQGMRSADRSGWPSSEKILAEKLDISVRTLMRYRNEGLAIPTVKQLRDEITNECLTVEALRASQPRRGA